jgi:hypothetical protein
VRQKKFESMIESAVGLPSPEILVGLIFLGIVCLDSSANLFCVGFQFGPVFKKITPSKNRRRKKFSPEVKMRVQGA